MHRLIPLLSCTLVLSALTTTALAEDADRNTHTVDRADLVITVDASARLQAGHTERLRIAPLAYTGPLVIERIHAEHGRVSKGDPLLRLDTTQFEDQLQSAAHAVGDQRLRVELAQDELDIMREANATRIERAEKAYEDSKTDLNIWKSYDGPRMLRTADLSTRQRKSGVLNQREELEQLKAMYEGAELESATKDIVLERARRSLAIAEDWLDISETDELVVNEYRHPRRERDTEDEVCYRREALEHARTQTKIGETRKENEIEQITRSLEDAERRVERLERDKQLFELNAPIDGLLSPITLEPDQTVRARDVIAEIHDTTTLMLTFNASPNDLRVLYTGQEVTVRVPELPEATMAGRIKQIADIGSEAQDATQFAVKVVIDDPHKLARLGLRATVHAEDRIADALLVPRNTVTWKNGRAIVSVLRDDDAIEERTITVGASNDLHFHAIKGVEAGERIVIDDNEQE